MKPNYPPLIALIDQLLRAGRIFAAQAQLRELHHRDIPRAQAPVFAALCVRAGLAMMGLDLLRPLLRPSSPAAGKASDEEKATYAACLIGIGACEEALALLREVNTQTCPEALLLTAEVLETRWSFRAAVPLLEQYLQCKGLSPQQSLRARAHLVAALIEIKDFRASAPLLETLLEDSKQSEHRRIHAGAIELLARTHMGFGEWATARKLLETQRKREAPLAGWDAFSLRKWSAMALLGKDGPTRRARSAITAIRKEAVDNNYWESSRQCDRALALATKDRELAKHLYFGTPYEAFRNGLLEEIGIDLELPPTLLYSLEDSGPAPTSYIDLQAGKDDQERKFEGGSLSHRLLTVLASDFYRPTRLATLFGELYPKQSFRSDSSPNRVHTLLRRLRRLSEERHYPLRIRHSEAFGWYRLGADAPFGIRVCAPEHRSSDGASRGEIGEREWWAIRQILVHDWPAAEFTAIGVAGLLRSSYRRARRLLETAGKVGWIEKFRRGNRTRYRVIAAPRPPTGSGDFGGR